MTVLAATAQKCSHRCNDCKPKLRDDFMVTLVTPGSDGVLLLQIPGLGWAVHTQLAH